MPGFSLLTLLLPRHGLMAVGGKSRSGGRDLGSRKGAAVPCGYCRAFLIFGHRDQRGAVERRPRKPAPSRHRVASAVLISEQLQQVVKSIAAVAQGIPPMWAEFPHLTSRLVGCEEAPPLGGGGGFPPINRFQRPRAKCWSFPYRPFYLSMF
jgi:hypothetical protein